MNRITLYLFLLINFLFSGFVFANGLENEIEASYNYDTYVGVNFKQNWIKPRAGWSDLLVREEPGFNLYFGWRFHPNFGAELGYEWTDNKPKSFSVANGSTLLGISNNSGQAVDLSGKVRFKTGALDLNAFIPLNMCPIGDEIIPEAILSAGVAGMKPSIKIKNNNTSTALTTQFGDNFTSINGRSRAIYRLGFGLQALVIENFGIRVLWRFESTSLLRARNSRITTDPATRVIFKDASTLALGLFFKF